MEIVLSDLLVTSCSNATDCENTPQIEIWLNNKEGFEWHSRYQLPNGTGPLTLADFNGDGAVDMVFPVCELKNNTCQLMMIANNQIGLCGAFQSSSSSCRSSQELCKADPNFKFEMGFVSDPYPFDPSISSRIRGGDYNLDGFWDLLVMGKTTMGLWRNQGCDSDNTLNCLGRKFTLVQSGTDALNQIEGAHAAAFVDLDEDGALDIIVLATGKDGQQELVPVYNNFFNDAYFLKAMGVNGQRGLTSEKAYGVNLPGAVIKYTVSSLAGAKTVVQGVQLSQSGNLALQTPYQLFGLGRASNYIEEIYLGVSYKSDSVHYHMWSGVIPNSQLVAIPYKPNSPEDWTLDLFIRSSGIVLWVVVAEVSCLIATGGAIAFFTWKEKKEDKLIKKETAHLFAFNA
eukprot:TRINITY_DN3480_c0_g1_i1.p1 TRINITY_DN3480_c0_g1~~TRINITY_DN3480_c0_g1_i1.p1  ORF type:complete len:400 (+),score=115.25 TRINITY_DN3480_c0_g1_i1:526-1725(+)